MNVYSSIYGESDWRIVAETTDFLLPLSGTDRVMIRTYNPNIKLATYRLLESIMDGEIDLYQRAQTYALDYGCDFENFFLHFSDDSVYTHGGHSFNILGWPDGSAAQRSDSRARGFQWTSYRSYWNFKDQCLRDFLAQEMYNVTHDFSEAEQLDGIFFDESTRRPSISVATYTSGGHIAEYGNQHVSDITRVEYSSDVANGLTRMREISPDKLFICNTAEGYYFGEYEGVMILGHGASGLFQEFWIHLQRDRPIDQDYLFNLTQAGKTVVLDANGLRYDNPNIGPGIYLDITERVKMTGMAWYYVSRDPGREYSMFSLYGNGLDITDDAVTYPAFKYNIGHPTGIIPPGKNPASGLGANEGMYEFATGTDNNGHNYVVYGREYDNALVLMRWRMSYSGLKDSTAAVTFDLPGSYYLLREDGNLDPTPITQITLTNSEGAILLLGSPTPICEATGGGTCYYVAVDGNDSNPGTFDEPFKTFLPAVSSVNPGDVIYARGGTYGIDNAMHYLDPGGSGIQYVFIAIKDFPTYQGEPAYFVNSGEEGNPIIVRNYPGEYVVLNTSNIIPTNGLSIRVAKKQYWIIQGFEIIGGKVRIDAGIPSTHDIIIKDNNIHDLEVPGDNDGLISIGSGSAPADGGPYNVFIWNNSLHDITSQGGLLGAIYVNSREAYAGADGGGTGYIEIINNTIYDVLRPFFFKNPMYGPIEIRDNVLYDANDLGRQGSANVRFVHNLVYNITGGFRSGEEGCQVNYSQEVRDLAGHNATIVNNTFVGLNNLFGIRCGTGHLVENNLFFGMEGRTPGAIWGTPAYIIKSSSGALPALDSAESLLQNITSNNNCFITPYSDFQFVTRYLPPEVTGLPIEPPDWGWIVEHRNYTNSSQTFSFDLNSTIIIENNPSVIFVDPSNNDYRLINPDLCPNMGYYAGEPQVCVLTYDEEPCNEITNEELGNAVNAWFNGDIQISSLIQHVDGWRS